MGKSMNEAVKDDSIHESASEWINEWIHEWINEMKTKWTWNNMKWNESNEWMREWVSEWDPILNQQYYIAGSAKYMYNNV